MQSRSRRRSAAVVVAAMLLAAPARAGYFISAVDGGAADPYIERDQLEIRGTITVVEEPCLRPDASLRLELWVLDGAYWPGLAQASGYRLVTVDLPPPAVVAPGRCESRLSATGQRFTVDLPPPGNYYQRTYFLRVEPSPSCAPANGGCYESFANVGSWSSQLPSPTPPPFAPAPLPLAYLETARAVEYHYAAFDHYFVTANALEIAALDGGQVPGWVRTGEGFNLWAAGSGIRAPLCRFFSAGFAPKSSHFYTPVGSECELLKQGTAWQAEGVSGYVDMPGGVTGNCNFEPASLPLYRLYNNGIGGAPSHRYTNSLELRAAMIAKGWIAEGYGPLGVIGCTPP